MPTINSKFYIKSSESPIFKKSYEALKVILKRIYGKDIQILGTLDENDINRELGRTTLDTASYPYIMITPSNITANEESYNPFALKKYGDKPKQHTDGYWYTFHLKPVHVTITVNFYSQNFIDCINFMSNWSFNAREGTFKLNTNNGIAFDIHVGISDDINFPTRDLASGNPLKVTGTLTLDTYVGEIYKSPSLKCIRKDIRIVTAADFNDLEPSIPIHDPIEEQLVVQKPSKPEIPRKSMLMDCDYLVVKYIWAHGSDLDTDTKFTNLFNLPALNNRAVGWSRLDKLPPDSTMEDSILFWSGDNTGIGQENVLVNLTNLTSDTYFDKLPEMIKMSLSATWYGEKSEVPILVRLKAYKGGTMSIDGFEFVNTGGKPINIIDADGIEREYLEIQAANLLENQQYCELAQVEIDKLLRNVTITESS